MNISDKLLWDLPVEKRAGIQKKLNKKPAEVFRTDQYLFVKALNSLTWYELIKALGARELQNLLTDDVLKKVFPPQRRNYYKNARRLLSKYSLSAAG